MSEFYELEHSNMDTFDMMADIWNEQEEFWKEQLALEQAEEAQHALKSLRDEEEQWEREKFEQEALADKYNEDNCNEGEEFFGMYSACDLF